MATANLAELRAVQSTPRESNLPAVRAGFFDLASFELSQRVAKAFASSELVPKQYQGNVANCMIALNLAQRLGADPLMVMQNLVIVHGRPTWSAQFLIATANMCGRFSALRFEFFGEKGKDSWGCRAWAIEKATGEKLVGTDVTIAMAKAEGWATKNGSKWQTIPQQMLMYRAGSWWVRAYAPELSMGLMTADEVTDIIDITPQSDGTYAMSTADLEAGIHSVEAQAEAPAEPQQPDDAPPDDYQLDGDSEPAVTYAQVADAINKSKTIDSLDVATDLIGEIKDEQQRTELVELAANRRVRLAK